MAIYPPGAKPQFVTINIPRVSPTYTHQVHAFPSGEEHMLPQKKKHRSFKQKALHVFRRVKELPMHLLNRNESPPPLKPVNANPLYAEPVPVGYTQSWGDTDSDCTEPLHRDSGIDFMDYGVPPLVETPLPMHQKKMSSPVFPDDAHAPKLPVFYDYPPPTLPPFEPFRPSPFPFFNPENPLASPNYDMETNIQASDNHPLHPSVSAPADLSTYRKNICTAAVLLGPDKKPLTFKQGSIGDCYLLAGWDALLHHADATRLLDQIQIESIDGMITGSDLYPPRYKVTFPSGLQATFNADEVGLERDGKKPLDGPHLLQILELAYAKATRSERNRERGVHAFADDGRCHTPTIVEDGIPEVSLRDMFGGETVRVDSVDNPPDNWLVSGDEPLNANANAIDELRALLTNVTQDTRHNYLLTATTPQIGFNTTLPFLIPRAEPESGFDIYDRKHSFSIRSFDTETETITIANPHDTASKVRTLPFSQFCQIFRAVSGIKLPK